MEKFSNDVEIVEVDCVEVLEDTEDMMVDEEFDIPGMLEQEHEHALTILPVAVNIISYLSPGDLKNARLVCRSWNEEGILQLSNKVKVVLNSDARLKSYMDEFPINNRKYFDTIQLGPYMYIGNPLAENFFQSYGLFIKHLILQKTQCSAVHLREILFRWAPNVEELSLYGMTPGKSRFLDDLHVYDRPNLHNLKVININLMLTQGEDLLRDFLYDLFSVSPNLEKVAVPRNTYKGFHTCLISTLLESNNLPLDNLSQVDALFSFENGQIQQLTNRGYPLESLNIQLMPNVTLDLLLPLLKSLNTTLKNLRLYFYMTGFTELPCPVSLQKLESLTLDNYQGSLEFTAELPELKELTVTMKCIDELEEAFPAVGGLSWCSTSLRSLKVSLSVVEKVPHYLIAKIHKSYPFLTSVSLQGLTDSSLKQLCVKYPNLEELDAPQGIYSDVSVTGVPVDRIKFLSLSMNLDEPACIAILIRQYSENIMSLPRLRKLRLQSQGVSDASIFFGILHCKELKELSIERSEVTDKGIDAIINHMDLHRLSITLCTRVSGPQLEVVKDKMKNRHLNLDFDEKRYTYSMYD